MVQIRVGTMKFQRTTLCYISKGNDWLFIRKVRKGDQNLGKYLGIGGHIEEGETPDECIVREIEEETGIKKTDLSSIYKVGNILFESDKYGQEEMHVYLAELNTDKPIDPNYCDEGELVWISKDKADDLPVWEGDKIMFSHLRKNEPFNMRLKYVGETLVETEYFE